MSQGKRWIDPKHKVAYLDWLMCPPGEREPATKQGMADHIEVSMRTLYNWEATPEFQEKMRSVKLAWGNKWYPDIMARLMDIVENGPPAQSVQASKVLLAHIDIKDEDNTPPEMEAELLKRMSAVLAELGYETLNSEE